MCSPLMRVDPKPTGVGSTRTVLHPPTRMVGAYSQQPRELTQAVATTTETQVVPIIEHCFDNAYAEAVYRSGVKWDSREELLVFITAMMTAFDEVQTRLAEEKAPTYERLLTELRECGSMIDCAATFNMNLADLSRVLTHGQPTIMETWDPLRWMEIEGILMEREWTLRPLAATLGVPYTRARKLHDWYLGDSPLPKGEVNLDPRC